MYVKIMFLSLLISALACTTGCFHYNSVVEEPEVIQGTFEELVTNKYLERSRSKEFDELRINRDDDRHKPMGKSTTNQEIIKKLLDYFNNLELVVDSTYSLSRSKNETLYYDLSFRNTHEFENVEISTFGDNGLSIYIVFHIIEEDKEKKPIRHTSDHIFENYTLVDETLDLNFLNQTFYSIDDSK